MKLEATLKQYADLMHISAQCVETGLRVRHSVVVKKSAKMLTVRLVQAIYAGVVFTDLEVKEDREGVRYIACKVNVMGRYLSADLKKLGF